MAIIDSHFHWLPRRVFEGLCQRNDYPRAERNNRGGYGYFGRAGSVEVNSWAEWFEPFYARVEELGVPIFLHPTDAVFADLLEGYGGALQLSLGRIVEVSVAASRLVLSGIMERHPALTVIL